MFWYKKGFYKNKPSDEALEISEDEYFMLMEHLGQGGILKEDESKRPYVELSSDYEQRLLEDLRLKRDTQCFAVINRGDLWYKQLSEPKRAELEQWYKQWLDVTVTKQVPKTPIWLK